MTSVLIYTETGLDVGLGHVTRMLHLANALQKAGAEVGSWPHRPTAATGWLHRRGVPMGPSVADIGVIDVMNWDNRMVDAFKAGARKLVVVIGAGQSSKARAVGADLMVYQTGWQPYGAASDLVPSHLAGPDYLILGPEYTRPSGVPRNRDALVVFGAAVPWSYSVGVVAHLSSAGLTGTLVVPPYHAHEFGHTKLPPGFDMICDPRSLRELQSSHRVQVGSLGMSTYEAVAAGSIPVVVGRSSDHVATGQRLERLGMAHCPGHVDDVTPATLAMTAARILSNYAFVRSRQPIMDGLGAQRVAKAILELA